MKIYDIISKKRDDFKLSNDEIKYFVDKFTSGEIKDYQVSALLMAIFLNGMNASEMLNLTMAMVDSGKRVDLSSIKGVKADKHSTGGVGDKTTMIVGPVVSSCGIYFAKMSGRGLGHTGGTIDKLESIPGFETNLEYDDFIKCIREAGIAVIAQTGEIVPADKKIYALRNATATIESIPLIASSIMSKKIAAGADRLLLDVKTGGGAFMKTLDNALELAYAMVSIGEMSGKRTCAIITDMDNPLGNAIGNSLEVIEAIETLKGKGPDDLVQECVELSARLLELSDFGDIGRCRKAAIDAIKSGEALERFRKWITTQKGNPGIIDEYSLLGKAKIEKEFKADKEGYITSVDAFAAGKAAAVLASPGGDKNKAIDYSAGVVLLKKRGDIVKKGETVAMLYGGSEKTVGEAHILFRTAYGISGSIPGPKPVIIASVDREGVHYSI